MRLEHLYIVLVIVGFAALVFIWNLVLNLLCAKMSHWPSVAAQFPSQPLGQFHETYKGSHGFVGKINVRRGFRIELSDEGLKITPRFAKTLPLFVPWSRLRSVESVPFSTLIRLDSDTGFYLPKRAFDSIRPKVRPEILR